MSAPIKIAPKPTTAQVGDGKIVLIQNSKGVQIPLKVVTQQKPGVSSNTVSPQNVQVVTMQNKNFVVKTEGSQQKTKFIVKSGTNQQIVLSTPTSGAQKGELKQTIVAPASSIILSPKGVQQVTSPPSTSNTNLHAVNIPGKGMQIVRILNTGANSPATTTVVSPSTTATSQTVKKPAQVVTKLTTIPTSGGEIPKGNQVLIKGKDGQTLTVLQTSSTPKTIISPATRTILNQSASNGSEKKEIKVEVVKKSPITITTTKTDEPPAKKAKYITLTPAQINQIQGATIVQKDGEQKKIVMLPSNYMEQLEKIKAKASLSTSTITASSSSTMTTSTPKVAATVVPKKEVENHSTVEVIDSEYDADGKKKKRACNCTKSQCLKFYCDCFANGEFCLNCNCKDCLNLKDCAEREKAIKICLERNPYAFKPKITADESEHQRSHVKGCNCKRSGCLKNYCECYEAKISCSANCKCLGCKNCEDATEKLQMEMNYLNQVGKRGSISEDSATDVKIVSIKKDAGTSVVEVDIRKKPYNFMTQDVIEATVQCMIAQGEECEKMGVSKRIAEKMILEEFGRCLVEIIEFSNKNVD